MKVLTDEQLEYLAGLLRDDNFGKLLEALSLAERQDVHAYVESLIGNQRMESASYAMGKLAFCDDMRGWLRRSFEREVKARKIQA